jgi:hypothetical protein
MNVLEHNLKPKPEEERAMIVVDGKMTTDGPPKPKPKPKPRTLNPLNPKSPQPSTLNQRAMIVVHGKTTMGRVRPSTNSFPHPFPPPYTPSSCS